MKHAEDVCEHRRTCPSVSRMRYHFPKKKACMVFSPDRRISSSGLEAVTAYSNALGKISSYFSTFSFTCCLIVCNFSNTSVLLTFSV
jgi:hypothetical protein